MKKLLILFLLLIATQVGAVDLQKAHLERADGTVDSGDTAITGDLTVTGTITGATNIPTKAADNTADNTIVTTDGATGDAIQQADAATPALVPGALTVTGIATAAQYKFPDTNIKLGNGTWSGITTGVQNIFMDLGGQSTTSGSRNFCGGRLTCESLTTGDNNHNIGYSVGANGYGVNIFGSHACSGINAQNDAIGMDWNLNSCFGHEAATPKDYYGPTYFGGEGVSAFGARIGHIGELEDGVDSYCNHCSFYGFGSGFGTNSWKYHTADLERSGTDTVTVHSTTHGYSDNDVIWFRDTMPNSFLDYGATTACALSDGVSYRVKSDNANQFQLEWCRSSAGASSTDLTGWKPLPAATISGCQGAASGEDVKFDSEVHSVVPNNTPVIFKDTDCVALTANTTYYACQLKPDGTTTHATDSLSFKTLANCTAGNTSNYVNLTTESYETEAAYNAETEGGAFCGFWTEPDFDSTYTDSGITFGFDSECDDVTGTVMVKLQTSASDLDYVTSVGADVVCDTSNTVCLGRAGTDTVRTTETLDIGSAGVRLSTDGDGAITFLGKGNGFDENIILNLDDTENTGTVTSGTGLVTLNFSSIALQESGIGVLNNDEIDASSELAAIMDDETGSGLLVFATSPVFTTPNIGSATGSVSGNAGTATALAADPSDCGANTFANTIAASGNLTCAAIADADVPDNITISLAAAASALAADPADCGAGAVATAIAASGALTCSITPIVSADIDTSAEIYGITTNETGSASGTPLLVFNQNPTLNGVNITGMLSNAVQAATCTENGSPSTLTITPTSSYIEITNQDAEGCNITMGETGMTAGMVATLCVVSNAGTTVNFADTAGVTELAGALAADIDDCITLRYGNTTTWREQSRSVN